MSVHRAALAAIGPNGTIAHAFVFPYVPESLYRSFEQGPGGVAETITVTFSLDATDALEAGDATASEFGLQPALAQLQQLLAQPWLVLSWGASRALPIQPTSSSVAEVAFDAALNPVRAEVTLHAHVVTTSTDPTVEAFVKKAQATSAQLAALYAPGPLPPLG